MENPSDSPTILILSGGVGASAEQVIYTVLAQFPDHKVNVFTLGNIRQKEQIDSALEQAARKCALVVHTLVDENLRTHLLERAADTCVQTVDLMGPLQVWLSQRLGVPPLQQPGRYRRLHQDYFERVSSIDYTLMHDDGKNPQTWHEAEIVLAGVSRAGKTPLSLYLAVLGWSVANIPLVPGLEVAEQIYSLDPRKCVGLTIEPDQLQSYRRQRQARFGVSGESEYTDLESIEEELRYARGIFKRCGFSTLDMTDKTIEMAADEVIRRIENKPPRAMPV